MALKRISKTELTLGMYIHAFDGSWFQHPFWRAKFVINDADQLEAVRQSKLDAVVIDTELGVDVTAREPAMAAADRAVPHPSVLARVRAAHQQPEAPVSRAARQPVALPPARPASGPVPVAREFGNARLVAGKAKKVISAVFLEARLGKAPKLAQVTPVVEDIFASIQRNPYAFSGLMRCKADSEIAYRHALSVSAMMVSLARQLQMPPEQIREAGLCGLLHDIGVSQLALDLDALRGNFDSIAPDLLERHVYIGHDMLSAAGDIPETVLKGILHHHERMDGSGFPQGLSGHEIDIYSRMAAICDTFDQLVDGAIHGVGDDPASALQKLMAMPGAFDPDILSAFVEVIGVYPIGSFVRLRSDRLAMVVDEDPENPGKPTVRVFYSLARRRHVPAERIALAHCFGADEIAGIAQFEELDLPPPQKLRETLFAAETKAR